MFLEKQRNWNGKEALLDYLPVGLRLPGLVQWVLRYTPKAFLSAMNVTVDSVDPCCISFQAHGVSLSTMYRNVAESTAQGLRNCFRCSVSVCSELS